MENITESTNESLPSWLSHQLPEPRPPYTIDYKDEEYLVVSPHVGGDIERFSTIIEAYDHASDKDHNDPDSGGLSFSDELPESNEEDNLLGMLVVDDGAKDMTKRLLISVTDEDRLESLKNTYEKWGEMHDSYVEDPADFLNSFYFLDQHPCFWVKAKNHDNLPHAPYEWDTSGHSQKLWFFPTRDDAGSIAFMMEAGSHIAPDYLYHYHDLRLDAYSDSYENVIIETAALVHKFFHKDGTERENVEYEKSALEEHLEEQMDKLNLD